MPVTVVCAVAFVIGGVVVAGRTEGISMLASLALVYSYVQLFVVPAPDKYKKSPILTVPGDVCDQGPHPDVQSGCLGKGAVRES